MPCEPAAAFWARDVVLVNGTVAAAAPAKAVVFRDVLRFCIVASLLFFDRIVVPIHCQRVGLGTAAGQVPPTQCWPTQRQLRRTSWSLSANPSAVRLASRRASD